MMTEKSAYERAAEAADYIRARVSGIPDTAVVLGSGLGAFGESIVREAEFPYGEIPHFPVSTVPGHAGKLIVGSVDSKRVVALQGRFHYYEGYDPTAITLYVRVLALLGVKNLILTNAAGAINTAYQPGDLMLITDHIGLFCESPLRGPNEDRFGTRFPSMSRVYDPDLMQIARRAAAKTGVTLREGVYCYTKGPQFETPAEIRALRIMGADACGMSTVPEAITAVHSAMRVLAISCATNMAAGILDQPLTHAEVMATGAAVEAKFGALMREICGMMEGRDDGGAS